MTAPFSPTIIVLSGPALDGDALIRLQAHLDAGLMLGQPHFVIDCRYVDVAGPDFANLLRKYTRKCLNAGGGLRVTGLNLPIVKLLDITHVKRSVETSSDISSAMNSLRRPSREPMAAAC